MIRKLFNHFFENLLIIQFILYERMMNMSEVKTPNGAIMEISSLAINYANVIMWGMKPFNKAPKRLKSDIAVVLYISGCEDLITDETYIEEAKERVADAENTVE